MSIILRVLLLFAALITAIWILLKIRKTKVKMQDAIFWVIMAFALTLLGLFPELSYWLSDLLQVQSPVNIVFLCIIFMLLEKMFTLSIKVSQLEDKLSVLSAEVAIRCRNEEEKAEENIAYECIGAVEKNI